MQLATTFRHMEVSQAVRTYAEERLDKIRKYFQGEPIAAHATFAVERNHYHMAEFQITLPNGILIQAREITEDMYSSIDLAGARIERQVRKWKEKIRDHKPHTGPGLSVRQRVIEAEALEPAPLTAGRSRHGSRSGHEVKGDGKSAGSRMAARGALPAGKVGRKRTTAAGEKANDKASGKWLSAPRAPDIRVVKEQTFTVRQLRVDDAVMQMNLLETEFFVFLDVDTKAVSVVYRRKDGNYGLIETGGRVPG